MIKLLSTYVCRLLLLGVCIVADAAAQEIDDAGFNRYLSDGKQTELEDLLKDHLATKQGSIGELYFYAVLQRSRFDKEVFAAATKMMNGKLGSERDSAINLMLRIDQRIGTEYAFVQLTDLGRATTDNSVLWLSCIACRELDRNEIGKELYAKLSLQWNPGPVLLHQTFANILDELHDYQGALVHRLIVNQYGDTRWGLDAYGNTLGNLGRHAEAEAAYRKALTISTDSSILLHLGKCLHQQGRYAEAKEILESGLRLDAGNATIHGELGRTLVRLEQFAPAEAEFQKALELDGSQGWIYVNYEDLARKMGHDALANDLKNRRLSLASGSSAAP